MTPDDDTVTDDDHRGMARKAGYEVGFMHRGVAPMPGWYVVYTGPDPSRRALRDIGPFDTEDAAWARAVGLAMEFRDGA